MKRINIIWIATAMLASFALTPAKAVPVVFYSDAHGGQLVHIGRVNIDGTNDQVLYTSAGIGSATAIDVDPVNQYIYFTESSTDAGNQNVVINAIRRMNFDGTGLVDLVTNVGDITGLSLDLPNGQMYWTLRRTNGNSNQGQVKRADLSGANISTILTGLTRPWAIEVDSVTTGKLYFGSELGHLQRSDLNGSNLQTVFQPPNTAILGVTIDPHPFTPKLYFTTETGDVYSSNPNGTGIVALPIPPQTGGLYGIDVLPTPASQDPLFWAQKSFPGELHSSNTAGAGYQVLLTTLSAPDDVAVVFIIPEPASAALTGLGSLLVLGRRKEAL